MFNVIFSTSFLELLLIFFLVLLTVLYFQYRKKYEFWKNLGVEQLNPTFPTGDLATTFNWTSIFVRCKELHNEFARRNVKYGGVYFYDGPIFMPVSPDLIRRILVTDFQYFTDRGVYMDKQQLPMSFNIFAMKGQQWRNIRIKCSPAFTSGKMKNMFQIFIKNVEYLLGNLNEYNDGEEANIKKQLKRLTSDIIVSTAFGIEMNTLKYQNEEFAQMVDQVLKSTNWDFFKLLIQEGIQNPGNSIKLSYNPLIVEYFTNLLRSTVEYREKNHIVQSDLMNIFLKLRETGGMTLDEIVSQCWFFFIAGYDTTSTAINYAIHELAFNQRIQENLRKEIATNLGRDVTKYTYDSVLNLPLLDRVIKETLRKHPSVAILHRMVVKPYKIPDTDIVLPAGLPVVISVLGLHRDPAYFPDPMKFDPERFNDDTNKIVPFSFIPFGDGPHNCIGLRFAQLQTKLVVAALVSNFKFVPIKNGERARNKMVVKVFKIQDDK